MTKSLKRIGLSIVIFLLVCLLYVGGVLAYGTIYDYQPEEVIPVTVEGNIEGLIISSDTLTAITWNIGYGGIGEESMMFYDVGKTWTSGPYQTIEPRNLVEKNIAGVQQFVSSHPADFYLFQEVDQAAKRSHYINQYSSIASVLPDYSRTFATNYQVDYVPIPILEPWNSLGYVEAGLATFSALKPTASIRFQLPGSYSWPTRIFHLDRCLAVHNYPVDNGKTFTLVHLHNSAYDQGGFIKKQQLSYLDSLITSYYNQGHYVLVGGDWNQTPPEVDLDQLYATDIPGRSWVSVGEPFMPDDWTIAFDGRYTTSRRVNAPYQSGKNDEKLIDYYLASPNIEVLEVETLKQQFKLTDHEPVRIRFMLR